MSETKVEPKADPFAGFVGESTTDPVPAAAEKAKSDPKEAEKADNGSESAQKEDEAASGKKADAEDEKPRKKSAEDRIKEVVAKQRAAERRAAELEAELAAARAPKEAAKDDKKEGGLTAAKDAGKEIKAPDPKDFEYGELDSRYLDAREAYLEAKIYAKLQAQQEQSRQAEAAARKEQESQKRSADLIAAGIARYEDFETSLQALASIPAADPSVGEMILSSDVGVEIVYHLAKNPQEAAEMAAKSPFEQARYLGKLEARLAGAAKPAEDSPKSEPKVTKAAAPVERARGSDGKFTTPDDSTDFAAFEAKYRSKRA